MTPRACRECGATNPECGFAISCGRLCRACDRIRCRAYYAAHRKERARLACVRARLRREHPSQLVNKRLQEAVRAGRVVKPSHCEDCKGEFPALRLQGHHADYTKPLEVRWLCVRCHAVVHHKYKSSTP